MLSTWYSKFVYKLTIEEGIEFLENQILTYISTNTSTNMTIVVIEKRSIK